MSRIKIQENLHQYKMGKSKVGALNIVPIFTQESRKLTVWWNNSQKYKLTKNQKNDEKHFNSL